MLRKSTTGLCFNKGRQCVNSQTYAHTCAPDEVRSGCVPISLLFSGFSFSLWEILDLNTSARLESFKLSFKPVFLNAAFSRSEVTAHRELSLSKHRAESPEGKQTVSRTFAGLRQSLLYLYPIQMKNHKHQH